MTFLFASIIILVASMVQGATSFGFSLLALPLLSLLYDLKIVVPTLVFLSLFLNITIFFKLKIKPNFKEITLLGIFAIIFIPVGVQMLVFVEERTLKLLVSVLLIMISIIMLSGVQLKIKNKSLSYIITGILSGILNGAVSLSGPPIVVLLANDNKNKNEFRSTLTFLFIILNIVTIALYFVRDIFNQPEFTKLFFLLPIMIIGSYLGIYLGNKIDENKFKKIVLVLLLGMGVINLF